MRFQVSFKEWEKKPLEKKVELSKKVIEYALKRSEKPCVAFSGGKNSLVVLHMVLQYNPDVTVLYNNTRNEFPETVKFVRELAKAWNLNFHEVKPDTNFWAIVKKYGYPHVQRYKYKEPKCCKYLKNRPAALFYKENGIDCVFTGISAYESRARLLFLIKEGLVYKVKRLGDVRYTLLKVAPVGHWTDKDIWEYIRKNELPVNPAYEKYGIDRVGCRICTGHLGWREQLKKVCPAIYRKIMMDMGQMVLEV
jgi:phosphoadenosine phosphosulfate reductase